ncbi:hypothetical protein DSM25558_5119 [Agrobacterium sp. DSM 25558]|uniref:hypothetical protein n=1 Tax=Agrobacterium sp. DSM 25558 TaxID=1907665 RepID=UPI0009724055|nr:hypothetical protein [Agrobacterium sp. DSM 25558]SCX31099.1 hypothetical protein DSM25558_5119 [Agrobacterium sp. DSM 25558]
MKKQNAQVHRFRENVAVYLGRESESTKYLTAKQARKLARELVKAAQSIEREEFTKSTFKTVEFEIGED